MFGYAVANIRLMTEEEKKRYREVYCGLCGVLRDRYQFTGRLALTYDMVFLIMLLSSLYNLEGERNLRRCAVHPLRAHSEWTSAVTAYAADMNMLFACLKAEDDICDEGSVKAVLASSVMKKSYAAVKNEHREKCAAVAEAAAHLNTIEQSGVSSPDEASDCFGEMMRLMFLYKDDIWSDTLGDMAFNLGKFIYILDAAVDLKRDIKHGSYNPLKDLYQTKDNMTGFRPVLDMLIGQSAMAFEKLPIIQDAAIIRNVLYSGIWLKYEAAAAKAASKRNNDESRSV